MILSLYGVDPLLQLSLSIVAAGVSTTPSIAAIPTPAAEPTPPQLECALESGTHSPAPAFDGSEIPNHPALSDRFFIGAGAGFMASNTQAQLNSDIGLGTNIDFENILGLDETAMVPQFLARWRFAKRWRLELEYFELNRSGSKVIEQDITWGDQTFPANSEISTEFDVSVARVSCGYSFFKTKDKEVGVALGVHLTNFDATLEGNAASEGGDLLAPLPVGSFYGQVALTDSWALSARLDAFKLEYDPYRGRILSIGIDALYQPSRHWGFGLGWRTLQIEGGVDSGDWNGEIDTTYQGPIAFVSASF
jgi:hypothetical protein